MSVEDQCARIDYAAFPGAIEFRTIVDVRDLFPAMFAHSNWVHHVAPVLQRFMTEGP
jgi:hypothetical protein